MAIPISDVTRRVVYSGSAGVGPYSFSFEVLAETDLAVYKDQTLLTLTTDYTVTINADGTGSVTLVVAATASNNITLVGDRAIARTTDFVTGGDLFANSLNDELDSLTIFAQQVKETADRGLKAPITDPTDVNMVLPIKASRIGKTLAFDNDGNPTVGEDIGNWRGDWAAGTSYTVRDLVKDPVNYNIYRVNTAHTSSGSAPISSNADVAKFDLVIDASSADEAEQWATKTDGIVESTDYSAKAWSIGGTGVTTTSGKGAAKEWATSTGAAVDTSEYSSKEYAIGDLTASGGSAKAWAIDSSSPDGSSEKSAKTLAGEASTSASNASTSASNASTSATNASNAQTYAEEWANKAEDSLVSTDAGGDGSTEYSAKHWAAKASSDAAGVAALYDAFDDRYLGSKSSDPTLDNDGNALTDGALYFNTTSNVLKVYDLGSTTWLTIPQLTLASMTDVTLTSIASGEILKWNGSAWVNNTLAEAGIVGTADIANMLETTDIGVTVQGYDADTAKYDDATANFTGTLQNGGSNVIVDSDIGSTVQAYDADTAKTDTAQTFTASQRGTVTSDNDLSFDLSSTNNFSCTPTAGGTLTFTNHTAGQSGFILLDNSSGYAITAAATTKINAADLATISTAGVYVIAYFDNGTNTYIMVSRSFA